MIILIPVPPPWRHTHLVNYDKLGLVPPPREFRLSAPALLIFRESEPAGHKNTLYLKPVDEDPLMIRAAKESNGMRTMV